LNGVPFATLDKGPVLSRKVAGRKGFPKQGRTATLAVWDRSGMPDTVKFLLVLLCLGGAIYGGVWALAHFPPEQAEIVKPLSSERLRAK
jgi:hypothetical protein